MKKSHVALLTFAIAACSAQAADGSNWLRIIPSGEFKSKDGRPFECPAWTLDEANGQRIVAALKKLQADIVIDYEHQTLHAEKNGQPAPAAGWMKDYEWRPDGIYARIEWTDRANTMIASNEYRYFSPVFSYDKKTGAVLRLHHGAITNDPALDESDELTKTAALRASLEEETTVNHAQLCAMLGLPETATEQEVQQALVALKAKADSASAVTTELTALKAVTDPTKFVPLSVLEGVKGELATANTELASLKQIKADGEVDELVKAGLGDGRLVAAQEVWARDLGKKDIASLKSYLDSAQPIPGLKTQSGDKKPPKDPKNLSESDLAVCRSLGITAEEFVKGNATATA